MPFHSIVLLRMKIRFDLVVWQILNNNLLFFLGIVLVIFLLRLRNMVLPVRIPLVREEIMAILVWVVIVVTSRLEWILVLMILVLLVITTLVVLSVIMVAKSWHSLILLLSVGIVLKIDLIWIALLGLKPRELQHDHSNAFFEPSVVKVRACFFQDPRQIANFILSFLHLPFNFALLFLPQVVHFVYEGLCSLQQSFELQRYLPLVLLCARDLRTVQIWRDVHVLLSLISTPFDIFVHQFFLEKVPVFTLLIDYVGNTSVLLLTILSLLLYLVFVKHQLSHDAVERNTWRPDVPQTLSVIIVCWLSFLLRVFIFHLFANRLFVWAFGIECVIVFVFYLFYR